MTTGSTTSHRFELWEYDAENADEYVGYATLSNDGCIIWEGISAWVDGGNDRAEFYLLTNDSRATWATFWD
ncbi:hypothetical protein [Allostreptomyces psammosilenae]|uniref:Uncharacterized protein n=1 Tax=Allostreptomyces psammosilenae TaxID=1892865 RepID=A0A852ZQC9_9ACTN|nr:hypothetical protein [Allostreptomyces psammosilenae]NYI03697.1 hypothetical protein [Allostreptomyces psammosilenae]